MGYYPSAMGHHMRRLTHDDNLLLYCVDGQGSLLVNHQRSEITAGDLMLLKQGDNHEYSADPKNPWTLYWVHFQGNKAHHFLDYMGYQPGQYCVYVGVSSAIVAGFSRLLAVRKTGYSNAAFIHAANQLRHLFTHFALQSQQPVATPETLNVVKVQAYMHDNIHRSLDLDDLSAMAGLSKYHFSHRYKALTGYPPMRHFSHMKMEAACRMLDTTEHSIQGIAKDLSFEDPLYFSRVFRNIIGCSPRQYRASRLG